MMDGMGKIKDNLLYSVLAVHSCVHVNWCLRRLPSPIFREPKNSIDLIIRFDVVLEARVWDRSNSTRPKIWLYYTAPQVESWLAHTIWLRFKIMLECALLRRTDFANWKSLSEPRGTKSFIRKASEETAPKQLRIVLISRWMYRYELRLVGPKSQGNSKSNLYCI